MAQPLLDLRASLGLLGYTGPATGYPNLAHLQAQPPEDHCPFSHTPWPGAQPYPYCLALDVMPDPHVDWKAVGLALFTGKMDGDPQLGWLKYLNWTDHDGNVWHDSWMPTHARSRSTDTGHVHASCRTDFVTSSLMKGWTLDMPSAQDIANALLATTLTTGGVHDANDVPDGYSQPVAEYLKWLPTIHDQLVALKGQLDQVQQQLGDHQPVGGLQLPATLTVTVAESITNG